MAYATTIISSATPAKTVSDWLKATMLANGWTAVETWTSGVKTAEILKSASTDNTLGLDLYISLYRASDAAVALFVNPFLEWDDVAKRRKKYAPSDTTTNITALTVDTDKTVAGAGELPDSKPGVSYTLQLGGSQPIWLQVDADTIFFGGSSPTNGDGQFIYAGKYDRLTPESLDPIPIVMLNQAQLMYDSVNSKGAVITEIGVSASMSYNWTAGCGALPAYAPFTEVGGAPNQVLSAQDVLRPNASAPVWFSSGRGGLIYRNCSPRGLLRWAVTSRSGGAVGDNLQVITLDDTQKAYKLVSTGVNNTTKVFLLAS